jgi:hypothetical protein
MAWFERLLLARDCTALSMVHSPKLRDASGLEDGTRHLCRRYTRRSWTVPGATRHRPLRLAARAAPRIADNNSTGSATQSSHGYNARGSSRAQPGQEEIIVTLPFEDARLGQDGRGAAHGSAALTLAVAVARQVTLASTA